MYSAFGLEFYEDCVTAGVSPQAEVEKMLPEIAKTYGVPVETLSIQKRVTAREVVFEILKDGAHWLISDQPNDQPIRDALRKTVEGLIPQIPILSFAVSSRMPPKTTPDHLMWMARSCLDKVDEWPVDKTSRWVGVIRGASAATSEYFSVDDERDRTRPLFHEAYKQMDMKPPLPKKATSTLGWSGADKYPHAPE